SSTAIASAAHPTAAPLFRTMFFVIMEPYRCTLAQAVELSAKHARATRQPPKFPAPDLLRFLRDALVQLGELHRVGVTHNMLHPELLVIAATSEDDFDTFQRFERSSRLSSSKRSKTSGGKETGASDSASVLSASKMSSGVTTTTSSL